MSCGSARRSSAAAIAGRKAPGSSADETAGKGEYGPHQLPVDRYLNSMPAPGIEAKPEQAVRHVKLRTDRPGRAARVVGACDVGRWRDAPIVARVAEHTGLPRPSPAGQDSPEGERMGRTAMRLQP